jgi:hypothetical protein
MAADRVHKQKISKINHVSVDKIVKMSCRNNGYPIKHTLKECELIKRYFSDDYRMTHTDVPSGPTDNEGKGDAYPDSRECLMIFSGSMAYESKHR